ncbi:CPBP family intramembrane glutamic endopeptidase [Ruminiclostridium papyrosolvens]|nr:CPBP family intramembrane glutamic endopeptidase [Ruminiclostridium papyrosolvens]
MKRYLKMTGYIVLYLILLYAVLRGVQWVVFNICSRNKALNDFLWSNKTLFSFSISIITISLYSLILKLRNKNLFKICSFTKISPKNVLGIAFMGISMCLFTTCFTSINFIGKTFPQFGEYMDSFFQTKGSFLIFIIMLMVLPMFEEIIFRGVIFNELRSNIPIVAAVLIQALIYGLLQLNPVLGTYAAIGSVIYVLPYIWTKSLWGSILVQDSCILGLFIFRKTGVKDILAGTGNVGLIILTLAGIAGILAAGYFVRKNSAIGKLKGGFYVGF